MFEPTLIEVQTERPLDEYRKMKVPILDQGTEGACTGFGLATVVHYLLRTRDVIRDDDEISPRMLYDMARRYDEWPGEKYSGSSARGAMKGWHKHGVCSRSHWIYDRKLEKQDTKLFTKRYEDALRRPLGAYFRVNHKDLIAMHAAITEVGILYATSQVHEGWQNVGTDGVIQWTPESQIIGGHAFAIVAYDQKGFWIQNSWADDWGKDGYAQISYDDWLANGSDIWVARLGAPVILRSRESVSRSVGVASQGSRSYVFCDLRPHIISLGNNGQLKTDGTYGTSEDDVKEIFSQLSDRIDASGSTIKHLLLYAHGGLTAEDSAIQKVADLRPTLLDAGVYPISFIWRTDLWSTIRNILQDAVTRRRPEGFLDNAKDFMLDRLDDGLEPIARAAGGHRVWAEMQQNAMLRQSEERRPAGGVERGEEAPRETPEAAGASGGTQRRFDSSWWTRRRQSGGRRKARAVFDLHDVGARLHDGLLSRELSAGHSWRQRSSSSRSSRSPIAPSRTTTARTSTTSRCCISCRTPSKRSCANPGSAMPTASRCSAWRSS